jgi:hypothetical protein
MEATEPPEPPCHAELEVCLDAAHAANPPPPPPPPPPAPPRMHPPETAAEAACHDRARACMLAEMGDKPGAGDAGSRAHPHCEPPGGAAGHAEPPHPPSPAGIGGAAGH